MKISILVLSFALLSSFAICQNVDDSKNINKEQRIKKSDATIDFESKVVDYGTIAHGSDGNREFTFTNNGTEPLIIKNARASCGCTVPEWPREPILPGNTQKIKVNYATNRVGKFTKNITLTTNADSKPVILTIKGEVTPPEKDKTIPTKNTDGSPVE